MNKYKFISLSAIFPLDFICLAIVMTSVTYSKTAAEYAGSMLAMGNDDLERGYTVDQI